LDLPERYASLRSVGDGDYREKGSKFLARAWPVADEAAISAALDSLRAEHPKARHVCYAWRLGLLGQRYRANDDQEPSGSAGRPILGRIDHHGLTQVLVAVVRYFGGVKLGVPGLIHAYRSAAEDALKHAGFREASVMWSASLELPNGLIGPAEGLLAKYRAQVDARSYGELAGFRLRLPSGERQALEAALTALDSRCRLDWEGLAPPFDRELC
jgi:uncharacterized YigZ family protein